MGAEKFLARFVLNAAAIICMSSFVIVSSKVKPIVFSSIIRTLKPEANKSAVTCLADTSEIVKVSKISPLVTFIPSAPNASRKLLALFLISFAIRFKPFGPCHIA